jgi:FkbM family methyltransferase
VTVLHSLRQIVRRLGLDVQRLDATNEARVVRILRARGIDCVLDVGANRGQYGRQLRAFGYAGGIRSFEPLEEPYTSLAAVAATDPNWSTWRLALGPKDGTASINVAGNEAAASSSVLSMLPRHEAAAPGASYIRSVEVPMKRLDAIWNEVVPADAVPFLKIDVQGFEGAVLDGARESIRNAIGLQLEISLVPLYDRAISMREILDRTEDLGMQLIYVQPGFADYVTGELLQIDGIFFRPAEWAPTTHVSQNDAEREDGPPST